MARHPGPWEVKVRSDTVLGEGSVRPGTNDNAGPGQEKIPV